MFSFYHERADLYFSWGGWMQIRVHPGELAPATAFPDRFDIREPDLRDPSRHPTYPADGSVHLVPQTQEAFETLCDSWWRGEEICVGLRDYATDPWQWRSWGITQGAFRYRYRGGSHIEASPAERDVWHPLIDLAAEDPTPQTVSTRWLIDRVDGWENAWLAAHGVLDQGGATHDAILTWTITHLPAPGARGSLCGQFGTWLYHHASTELTSDAWHARRNLGEPVRRITPERPWSTTRDDPDGTRWNFWWSGHPHAYVYSPDRPLTRDETDLAETHFALHSHEIANRSATPWQLWQTRWLHQRADAWPLPDQHST